jgi:RNA polymerase sigma-70 factor (ECF subfamily)
MDERRARFEAQVLPHFDAAYRFARWLVRSQEGVDDLVQEALLRAFRGFDGLRGADAKAWLMTIVRNSYLTTCQQAQRHTLQPLPEDYDGLDGQVMIASGTDPESSSMRKDDERLLHGLLAALPDDYREVLVLREIEEMDYRQIAAVVGIPLGTVMSRLARARAALRKQWLRQAEGDPRAMP